MARVENEIDLPCFDFTPIQVVRSMKREVAGGASAWGRRTGGVASTPTCLFDSSLLAAVWNNFAEATRTDRVHKVDTAGPPSRICSGIDVI